MTTARTDSGLTRRTYSRLVYGIVAVGILGLLAGFVTDRQFAGTVVYLIGVWIGGGIAVASALFLLYGVCFGIAERRT